jgi:hypothetical protein
MNVCVCARVCACVYVCVHGCACKFGCVRTGQQQQQLVLNWTQVTSHALTPDTTALGTNQAALTPSKTLYLPPGTLQSGLTYVFRATVAVLGQPNLFNSADLTVEVQPPLLRVGVLGGDRLRSIPADLVLEASASVSPSDSSPTTYIWSCALRSGGQACFAEEALAAVEFAAFEQESQDAILASLASWSKPRPISRFPTGTRSRLTTLRWSRVKQAALLLLR